MEGKETGCGPKLGKWVLEFYEAGWMDGWRGMEGGMEGWIEETEGKLTSVLYCMIIMI